MTAPCELIGFAVGFVWLFTFVALFAAGLMLGAAGAMAFCKYDCPDYGTLLLYTGLIAVLFIALSDAIYYWFCGKDSCGWID